jgi:hypothetical protein
MALDTGQLPIEVFESLLEHDGHSNTGRTSPVLCMHCTSENGLWLIHLRVRHIE